MVKNILFVTVCINSGSFIQVCRFFISVNVCIYATPGTGITHTWALQTILKIKRVNIE